MYIHKHVSKSQNLKGGMRLSKGGWVGGWCGVGWVGGANALAPPKCNPCNKLCVLSLCVCVCECRRSSVELGLRVTMRRRRRNKRRRREGRGCRGRGEEGGEEG